jgi:hypothetical protein
LLKYRSPWHLGQLLNLITANSPPYCGGCSPLLNKRSYCIAIIKVDMGCVNLYYLTIAPIDFA